jgi:hypothetical protein
MMNWIVMRLPDGTRFQLTNWNCHIFIHADQYKDHDHVFVQKPEDELGMYIFDHRELIQTMMNTEWYSYTWAPIPVDSDIEAFKRWRQNTAIETTAEEVPPPISEEEIDAFMKEAENGIIRGHEDELDED